MKLQHHPRTPRQYLRLFLTGIAMGTADVIPGVSGGTMAFILGIYEDLLNAIKSFDVHLIKLVAKLDVRGALDHVPWQFLVALFLGIGSAVLTLAHLVHWMMSDQYRYILLFAFFFGLILASILAIGATIPWKSRTVVALVVGTVVAFIIVNLVPLDMPHDPLTLFLSGMVAIMAMILPGISGSFILLILGQYEYLLRSVKQLQVLPLIFAGIGSVVGIIGFSRVLSWLLKRYHQATIAALVGFMVGSLWKIWPWKEFLGTRLDRHEDVELILGDNILPNVLTAWFWLALLLCLVGFLVVCFLDHLLSGANPVFRLVEVGRGKKAETTPEGG
jgi:putative membrane protein